MEGENKETKITSVEKERVKDPRRVEQGKKLAAISREAKERKARERQQRADRSGIQVRVFQSSIHSDHSRDRRSPSVDTTSITSTVPVRKRKWRNHQRKRTEGKNLKNTSQD